MPNHLLRTLLIGATLAASWWGMQIVHECGHVVGAWVTGGTVADVVLHPLSVSRTDVAPNPRPLAVVWSGPAVGCLLPLMVWWLAWRLRSSAGYLFRFFAGFCCVANGAYLGAGVLFPVGDARVMRAEGTPVWALGLFGAVSVAVGLRLWNGLGGHFGLGPRPRPVNRRHAAVMTGICLGIIVVELLLW